MNIRQPGMFGPPIRTLTGQILSASVPKIIRIVALVDKMIRRGPADQLIEPLRERLARLRLPRPLRFDRLLFHPLDVLIVPTAQWQPGRHVIPRTVLMPMAEHVRRSMGEAATAIETEIDGRSTADGALISRLGRSLWPAASQILADPAWNRAELGEMAFRPLAGIAATLLAEAANLDMLRAEAATGLLSPAHDLIEPILARVAQTNQTALPMVTALLFEGVPEAARLPPSARPGSAAAALGAVRDEAADLLLQQLDREDGIVRRIAPGTLAEAGAAVSRLATLLMQLDTTNARPPRRDLLRALRLRLEAGCKERFASGLHDELLALLGQPGTRFDPDRVDALEAAARGLRMLEAAGRVLGSGGAYDPALRDAAAVIKSSTLRDSFAPADRARLVEILGGSDAALAMLDQPG